MTHTRPQTNPDARDPDDVLGTTLPDTVSACTWKRPYTYYVVRTDDGRLSRLDDHELGRVLVEFKTRHNAVGSKTRMKRRSPDSTYEIVAEPNESYEG